MFSFSKLIYSFEGGVVRIEIRGISVRQVQRHKVVCKKHVNKIGGVSLCPLRREGKRHFQVVEPVRQGVTLHDVSPIFTQWNQPRLFLVGAKREVHVGVGSVLSSVCNSLEINLVLVDGQAKRGAVPVV